MSVFCIIETDDGHIIVERGQEADPVEVAESQGGVLIDPGPYHSYDDAQDALVSLEEEIIDEESSDVPTERPLESRYEVDDR